MNRFDTVFKILHEKYQDVDPEFDVSELEDLDFSQHDLGKDNFIGSKVNGDELVQYNYKLVELAILEALDTQIKPLMIYGESGIGKSKIIYNIAKKIIAPNRGLKFLDWKEVPLDVKKSAVEDPEFLKSHYMFIDIRAAELEPIDLRGIELPTSKAPYLDPKTPLWIYYASRPESNGLLFFDELNQAMRQVFNAMFGVILDRQAGDLKFSDNWGIIAASNLGGDVHSTVETLPVALTQRFDTIYLVADPNQWAEWAMTKDDRGLTRIEPDVVSYALSDTDRTFLVKATPESSQSIPNPRNLEAFSKRYRLIKHYYSKPERLQNVNWLTGDIYNDIRHAAIKTCGESWANGFIQFIKVYSKLNWDDLAKNAKQYATKDLEQVYAYIYFVSKKTLQTLGFGRPLYKKLHELMMKEHAGERTNESDWEEGRKFLQQFANIASYLVYQVKDIGTNGAQGKGSDPNLAKKLEQELDGDGEHLATLINMIRSGDKAPAPPQECMTLLLFMATKYQTLDPDIKTLLLALKQIVGFGEKNK